MYYPIQIPYLLNMDFAQRMEYMETPATEYGGFVICFWEMKPLSERGGFIENVIVADGCIDLVASYDAGSFSSADADAALHVGAWLLDKRIADSGRTIGGVLYEMHKLRQADEIDAG
jgi:hypothetical protein